MYDGCYHEKEAKSWFDGCIDYPINWTCARRGDLGACSYDTKNCDDVAEVFGLTDGGLACANGDYFFISQKIGLIQDC